MLVWEEVNNLKGHHSWGLVGQMTIAIRLGWEEASTLGVTSGRGQYYIVRSGQTEGCVSRPRSDRGHYSTPLRVRSFEQMFLFLRLYLVWTNVNLIIVTLPPGTTVAMSSSMRWRLSPRRGHWSCLTWAQKSGASTSSHCPALRPTSLSTRLSLNHTVASWALTCRTVVICHMGSWPQRRRSQRRPSSLSRCRTSWMWRLDWSTMTSWLRMQNSSSQRWLLQVGLGRRNIFFVGFVLYQMLLMS